MDIDSSQNIVIGGTTSEPTLVPTVNVPFVQKIDYATGNFAWFKYFDITNVNSITAIKFSSNEA
jgi:hypothetical protein